MTSIAVTDAVRYAHLFSVAVGLGASFLADFQVFRRLEQRVTKDLIGQLHLCHRLVWAGLICMWITGIGLIYIRTDFVLAEFSPKLFSKLLIVMMLTFNAFLIGKLAMPLLERRLGQRLTDMSLGQKLLGGWLASISSASWLLALALGESKVLASSNWDVFQSVVPMSYMVALLGATMLVLTVHVGQAVRVRRRHM